jgi:Ser/Thr protein kinase RdoA (MazF antagonist)/SAM-dependent methyltransferase
VPDPFPAQRSIVSAAALAARLLPCYDLPPPVRCEFLQQGDNDTYLVHAGTPGLPDGADRPAAPARSVLRVYRLGKHPRAAVEAEVALLDMLHTSGAAVAPAIRRRDGAAVATLEAPEGPRYAVLFAFAPGDLAGFGMTPAQARRYGQEVARLHAAADAASGPFARPPLDLEALLDRPLARLAALLAHRPRDAAALRALADRLRGRLAALPRTRPQWGLCHGDLHKRNVVFAAGDAPTILDFDCAGEGWRAYDLAVLLWSTALQGLGTALWERYLEGYQELRPLGPAERDAVPAFVAARDLWTMGVEAGRVEAGAVGRGQLPDSYWDRRLAALHAWCGAAGLGPDGQPPPRPPGTGTVPGAAGASGHAAAPDGDAPRAEPEYHRLVRDGVLDAHRFVRAVFSGRRRGHPLAWERLVLRPVEVRGRPRVQFTYHDARRSVDRNLAGRALRDELAAALRLPFRSVFVELTDRELHVTFNKRGEVAVRSGRKTEPVARTLAHDHQKRQPLPAGAPDPYLIATGVMAPDGRVRPDKYDKFRQINEFLRLLDQLVTKHGGGALPDTVVDLGCGNAYLAFAAYHHFRHRLGHPVALCGVDVQGPLLVARREQAARLGWDALTFVESAIADYAPPRAPDLVLSLHACDTATDDALARAIRWRSRYVLSVPCCQHELQQQLRTGDDPTALRPVYRDGILAERLGDVLTDTLRALILRICGYATDVVQFVSAEHTAKNLMLRAARTARPGDPAVVAEYVRLRDFLGVTPYLECLLGAEFAEALGSAQTAGDTDVRGIRCSPGHLPPAP